jgi:outer membrane protein TolC
MVPATLVVLLAALAGVNAAQAQTPLTLEEAIARAQGETADARVLASSVAAADSKIRRARAGFWPQVDVTETVERGDQPVFVFGSLLAQRRFTVDNFALPALNHPDPVTNTRTSVTVVQTIFDGSVTRLGVDAATLDRQMTIASRATADQDLAFRAAEAFVRVLQLEGTVRATAGAVAAAESDRQRARARRDVGLVTEADLLAIDVHLADMLQRQIAAGADLAVARMQLAESVGLPLTAAVAPVRPA